MKHQNQKIYFLGIGGIGMSALARYFHAQGAIVSGYDRTKTHLTESLEQLGIQIHYQANISLIPDDLDFVIYTPAIDREFEEFRYLSDRNVPLFKRSEILAKIADPYYTIAIAGTHGKTTMSAMATHILKFAGRNVLAFVGGIMKNYHTNTIIPENPELCVVEADEYDRSFLRLHPDIAVISAIDPDHLDIYGTYEEIQRAFQQFIDQCRPNAKIFVQYSYRHLCRQNALKTYGIDEQAVYHSRNIRLVDKAFMFDVYIQDACVIQDVVLPYPGRHNIENALAAAAIAISLDIKPEQIRTALATFRGLERRFDVRCDNGKYVYIDDYAHHPSEIDALIDAVRLMYPDRKITGIFQPHLFTRTRDLAEGFARSLARLDELVITDIYPAREKPIPGISASWLLQLVEHKEKYYVPYDEIIDFVMHRKPELLLTIGAGDIDKHVEKIEMIYKNLS